MNLGNLMETMKDEVSIAMHEADKFSDEGKIVFARLVEVQQDIQNLTRKIEILQAAAITLNVKIKDQLSEEMKTTLGDVAEAS